MPTYGVIVHGISTNSINVKKQKATIQQMLADNYTVIPNAEVSYIGWLTEEANLKRVESTEEPTDEPTEELTEGQIEEQTKRKQTEWPFL